MIPGVDLTTVLTVLGYGVALIIFAETGLMVGFFLPGDSLLFTAGALTGAGLLHVNVWLLSVIFFVAAIAGNTTGYLIGRHFGRKLFDKPDSRIFKQKYLTEAEKFYQKNGGVAVILAQFVPIIRTFNPIITGVARMDYRKFIAFNIIGALIWTFGFTLGGYFLSGLMMNIFGVSPEEIDKIILPIVAVIVIVSLIPALVHLLKDKQKRAMILTKVRAIFNKSTKEGQHGK